ncbi:MAG: class I SAM-dependent methyltransferase [Chloroflexi bacterium]|nr:class I SAM-dependent methyltransferase [Chloroflexota bacterium]
MSTYWNAEVYDRIGTPMRGWARQVIEDLALAGDETVLDAGCGSGSVTFDLLKKLPRGKIYAVDASAEMIASLARGLEERGVTNVIPIVASLTDFTLPEQVDAVFSNAVFHWIPDDDALFGCLYRAAKPGGRLRAQCGGYGNNAHVLASVDAVRQRPRFKPHLRDFTDSKKYRTPEEAKASLERAGWRDARASLFAAPVPFERNDEAALYVQTILLRDHVARLPEEHRDAYGLAVVEETVRRYGAPYTADYVRLDLWARK